MQRKPNKSHMSEPNHSPGSKHKVGGRGVCAGSHMHAIQRELVWHGFTDNVFMWVSAVCACGMRGGGGLHCLKEGVGGRGGTCLHIVRPHAKVRTHIQPACSYAAQCAPSAKHVERVQESSGAHTRHEVLGVGTRHAPACTNASACEPTKALCARAAPHARCM